MINFFVDRDIQKYYEFIKDRRLRVKDCRYSSIGFTGSSIKNECKKFNQLSYFLVDNINARTEHGTI